MAGNKLLNQAQALSRTGLEIHAAGVPAKAALPKPVTVKSRPSGVRSISPRAGGMPSVKFK